MSNEKDELNLQLQINLTYDLDGASRKDIIRMLEGVAERMAGMGGFTDDSPATVRCYDSQVFVWDEEEKTQDAYYVECDQCARYATDKAPGDPCDHCPGEMFKPADHIKVQPVLHAEAEDECPNCKCGTLGHEGEDLVCRGECGAVFPSPIEGEKMLSRGSELLSTIENELNNQNDWCFNGARIEVAVAEERTLFVRFEDGSGLSLRARAFPEVYEPDWEKLNGSTCDDGGCPGWVIDAETNEIQRCDTCQRFDSDDSALAYVHNLWTMDVGRHLKHNEESLPQWLKSHIQFPRLLSELLAHMEVSEDTETMNEQGYMSVKISDLCDSMDLGWTLVLELLHRADAIWEHEKALTFRRRP